MAQIVIIGNGIAGITCARHLRKASNDSITVISAETEHFYARTALMYIYMGHMKYEHTKPYEDFFWKKNRIDLIQKWVEKVDENNSQVVLRDGTNIQYDKLVIATGSKSNLPNVVGNNLKGVQGLYGIPDLQQMESDTKNITNAVVVGGGLIGIELAEMLLSRNIQVTMLVRESAFWGNTLPEEEAKMIGRHIEEHKIDLKLNTELAEIIDDNNGKVKAVKLKNGEIINCGFVGLAIGVSANVDFLKNSKIEIDKGVLVNEFFETNIANIYAIGDCVQFKQALPGRKNIEQIWYTGRMHGETLAKTLSEKRTAYKPGPWFNSAKFLDIEYQNYGDMPVKPNEGEKDFYWEERQGKIALRLRYNTTTKFLIAVNAFGMRLRHAVLENWLLEKKDVEYVLVHLKDANFDPEFSKHFEGEIIRQYNNENGTQLKPKNKSWKRLLKILNPA